MEDYSRIISFSGVFLLVSLIPFVGNIIPICSIFVNMIDICEDIEKGYTSNDKHLEMWGFVIISILAIIINFILYWDIIYSNMGGR